MQNINRGQETSRSETQRILYSHTKAVQYFKTMMKNIVRNKEIDGEMDG